VKVCFRPFPDVFGGAIAAFLLAAIYGLALPGCANTPREAAYKTLALTAHTVDSAMEAYADAVVAGKVGEPTQAKVRDIKTRYEKAFVAAVEAAKANLDSPTPQDLKVIAASLLQIIEAATGKASR